LSSKADFTPDQWTAMQKGAMGAGLLVSMTHKSFSDSVKEAGAVKKHLKQLHESSPSLLVRDLADVKGTGFGLKPDALEVERETISALEASVATLSDKAPGDLPIYREFVLDIVQTVAQAEKGVGGAGQKDVLGKIDGALKGA
jgi:hypothetical protein